MAEERGLRAGVGAMLRFLGILFVPLPPAPAPPRIFSLADADLKPSFWFSLLYSRTLEDACFPFPALRSSKRGKHLECVPECICGKSIILFTFSGTINSHNSHLN